MSKVLGVKKENNNLAELLSCQAEECRGSGRKNWLFANTPLEAKASTTVFSIIETAKDNEQEPYEYLCCIFNKGLDLKAKGSPEILLPWNAPKSCRAKSTKTIE